MRKVVRELIEPTITRSHEDRERTNTFRLILDEIDKRVHKLENIVIKKGEKMTAFEDIHHRISIVEQERLRDKEEWGKRLDIVDWYIELAKD